MTRNVFLVTPNGPAIRAIREAQGRSLRDIAGETGLSPSFLAQIEREERSARQAAVEKIADALGVAPAAITREGHMAALVDDEDANLRLYSANSVAELWEISASWLQKAAANGSIECTYLQLPGNTKGLLRFSRAQVIKALAGFTVQPVNADGRKAPMRRAA